MPNKIELPPKVKCWRCTEGQVTVVVGEVKPGPDIPENLVGTPLYGFEPCDCDDGERYDFDEVAAAVRIRFGFACSIICSPTAGGEVRAEIETEELAPFIIFGIAPNDTAALVAAVEKHNEG